MRNSKLKSRNNSPDNSECLIDTGYFIDRTDNQGRRLFIQWDEMILAARPLGWHTIEERRCLYKSRGNHKEDLRLMYGISDHWWESSHSPDQDEIESLETLAKAVGGRLVDPLGFTVAEGKQYRHPDDEAANQHQERIIRSDKTKAALIAVAFILATLIAILSIV